MTKKRAKKLLMSFGYSRNLAETILKNKLRMKNDSVVCLATAMPKFANAIVPVIRDILDKFLKSISDILKPFENRAICGTDAGRAAVSIEREDQQTYGENEEDHCGRGTCEGSGLSYTGQPGGVHGSTEKETIIIRGAAEDEREIFLSKM